MKLILKISLILMFFAVVAYGFRGEGMERRIMDHINESIEVSEESYVCNDEESESDDCIEEEVLEYEDTSIIITV